jgi:hypothetical protein
METRAGQNMSPEQRNAYLKPYVQTSILKEQLVNLVVSNDGGNIILKRSSTTILKDKFSAAIYGLYYIKMEEERRSKRRTRDFSQFMFFS